MSTNHIKVLKNDNDNKGQPLALSPQSGGLSVVPQSGGLSVVPQSGGLSVLSQSGGQIANRPPDYALSLAQQKTNKQAGTIRVAGGVGGLTVGADMLGSGYGTVSGMTTGVTKSVGSPIYNAGVEFGKSLPNINLPHLPGSGAMQSFFNPSIAIPEKLGPLTKYNS